MIVLAIDPGYEQSAFAFYDDQKQRLLRFGIVSNDELLNLVRASTRRLADHGADRLAVEKIAMGGMIAGQETFDTAMLVGRIIEAWDSRREDSAALIRRIDEKMCLCRDSRAKDANIRQALIDMFGPGKEKAIGTKKSPGPLYGVTSHVWSALAVAVTFVDGQQRKEQAA